MDIETSSSRTSAQTLDFLKEKFTPSGLAAKWAALSKLSSISYKGSITNTSAEFKTVWTEITDLNVEVKDVILLTLLNSLGPEWNQYCTVLNEKARKDNSITFDDTVKGLIDYEQGMKNEVSAYWTRTTPESNSNNSCSCCRSKGHQKPSCFHRNKDCRICYQKGHTDRVCPNKPKSSEDSSTAGKSSSPKKPVISCYLRLTNLVLLGQIMNAPNVWIIDSGSTDHICGDRSQFVSYRTVKEKIVTATNEVAWAFGRGDVILSLLQLSGEVRQMLLSNVLHGPVGSNLISTTRLATKYVKVCLNGVNEASHIVFNGEVVGYADIREDLYQLRIAPPYRAEACSTATSEYTLHENSINDNVYGTKGLNVATTPPQTYVQATSASNNEYVLWHRRFAHLAYSSLQKVQYLVQGLCLRGHPPIEICGECMKGR